ncbi:unnamed protein product [Hermetia illucens]|uniref:CSN8/PSMD8/EIF3K domain-containing protein n=1 Tax=Hermetia illucens TaxID=343691 RepID=A0A7R8YQW7_HERIL|nr:COP9 signalosome complex subunit 8 [Hermetia illucens]CAD7078854.1 unnamed protein product [Hermetia illucens]
MFAEKVQQLIQLLEKQELEAENGIVSPQLYLELFAAYLYQNDLCNARFLWKRIPQNVKSGNAELTRIHNVYLALWNNNSPEFFKAIEYEWSSNIAELIFELKEKVKQETLDLIGMAYSSIFENVLIEMANITPDKVTEVCSQLDWKVENGNFPRLIIPKRRPVEQKITTTSEDQLFILTDFVSFLEN